jgi:glycosyltransferase involved in cell wall biosynthesis
MISTPLVSVYIPCHNYGRYLNQALNSLRNQLYTNWELFIVDEASDDDTQVIASHFQMQTSQSVHIIRNSKPRGLQRVANHVLSIAKGKYIVRLDADDWLDESALLLMTTKLELDPGLGLVYGNYFFTNQDGKVLGFERRHRLNQEDESNHLPPHGACTMVRTKLLKSVGGYSEDINAQDGWELWFNLIQRSRAASLEAPIFYYRQHSNSLSRDSTRLLEARARIFAKLVNKKNKGYHPSCLAVVPAKESYPHFERVPFSNFKGNSLLQIAIHEAQRAESVTDVMVSSDSESVLQYTLKMERAGVIDPVMRVKRLGVQCYEHFRPQDILLDAAAAFMSEKNFYPDIVIFLSLHAPFRKAQHIDRAVNVLLAQAADSVVSVCEEREPIFAHGKRGLNLLNPGRFDGLSHEREKLYSFNGSIIASWIETLSEATLFGESIGYLEMSPEESFQIKDPAMLR